MGTKLQKVLGDVLLTDTSECACGTWIMDFGLSCLHPDTLMSFSWGLLIRKVEIAQIEF